MAVEFDSLPDWAGCVTESRPLHRHSQHPLQKFVSQMVDKLIARMEKKMLDSVIATMTTKFDRWNQWNGW